MDVTIQQLYDIDFRKSLKLNDKEALKKFGLVLTDDIEVKVLSNTANVFYMVLTEDKQFDLEALNDIQAAIKASTAGSVGTAVTASTASTSPTCAVSSIATLSTIGSTGSAGCNN